MRLEEDAAMMYDGWWGNGWGWAGWVLMCVVMVLFCVVLITAIVVAIRYLAGSRDSTGGTRPSRPEHLLAERFAPGEIDEDEYWRRMTVLREHR
jgi:putative membrane protein